MHTVYWNHSVSAASRNTGRRKIEEELRARAALEDKNTAAALEATAKEAAKKALKEKEEELSQALLGLVEANRVAGLAKQNLAQLRAKREEAA